MGCEERCRWEIIAEDELCLKDVPKKNTVIVPAVLDGENKYVLINSTDTELLVRKLSDVLVQIASAQDRAQHLP